MAKCKALTVSAVKGLMYTSIEYTLSVITLMVMTSAKPMDPSLSFTDRLGDYIYTFQHHVILLL